MGVKIKNITAAGPLPSPLKAANYSRVSQEVFFLKKRRIGTSAKPKASRIRLTR
jgi:hypothetical protein